MEVKELQALITRTRKERGLGDYSAYWQFPAEVYVAVVRALHSPQGCGQPAAKLEDGETS